MPSFNFLIAALLLSYWTTRGRAASHSIPYDDLRKHCSFDLNGYVYNLCPLMGSTKVVEVPEKVITESREDWRTGSGRYVLALGGFGKDVGETLGCDEETWLCLTRMHGHGFRSIPVIQKGKSSNLNLIVELGGNVDHGLSQLRITFHGAKQDLDVVIVCSDVERVELINVRHDTLRFVWASRHGCPRTSSRRRGSESALNTWTNGEQEPSGGDREGDEELLPSDSRKARTSIAFVVAFIVLSVICGSALASSARARHFVVEHLRNASYAVVPVLAQVGLKLRPLGRSLNTLTSKAISSVRFRQGDDNLVRWAQEDMALDSDMMVNHGPGVYGQSLDEERWDGSNEYIPLATSSRFRTGGRMQSYGSTGPEVANQERGVMSRMKKYFKL